MNDQKLQWTGERFLPWFSNIQPDIALEHMSRYFAARKFCKDKTVLDVACGEGYGSEILSETAAEVLGVDISKEAVKNARASYESGNLRFAVQDALCLEKLNQVFDLVTAFEMIEHIQEQEAFLRQVRKVLKKGGIFMVSTPDKYVHEHEWHTQNEFHVRELYFYEFKELLEKYFPYCYFYGQRVYRASEIWQLEGMSQNTLNQDDIALSECNVRQEKQNRSPGYYLCICSDQPVDGLKSEYFLTDVSDQLKKHLEEENHILKDPTYHYQNHYALYYDYGNGFSEQEKETCPFTYTEYLERFHVKVNVKNGLKKIRLDPVDQRYCIIKNLEVKGFPKEQVLSDQSRSFGEFIVFEDTKDPWFIFDLKETEVKEIVISYDILIYESTQLLDWFIQNYDNYQNQIKESEILKEKNSELQEKCSKYQQEVSRLKEHMQQQEHQYAKVRQQNQDIQEKSERMQQEISGLLRDITQIYESTSWKFSTPIRIAGRLAHRMCRFKMLHQCLTAVKILKNGGPSLLFHEIRNYKTYKSVPQADEVMDIFADIQYQEDMDFSDDRTDIKAVAFYLPQYHTFPENDAWWGEGFTEWVNVKNGDARFYGHYQPRVPHKDIGYYDLSDIRVLEKQAQLAKRHGIYGFCFYYYWFSGKRLMETPVDLLLKNPQIDLHFCLCWANENWTRAWDGKNRDILIAQNYSVQDDHNFIPDMRKYLDDPRYIRINGKPVILVYNPGQIPDCQKSFDTWRRIARESGIGELLIWTCRTANHTAKSLHMEHCIDAEVEFPPHNMWWETAAVRNVDLGGKSAYLYSYEKVAAKASQQLETAVHTQEHVYPAIMLAWDNAARRKDGWFTYCGFSLKNLYQWTLTAAEYARQKFSSEERFLFINAWNEWGEGTYLEPDEAYGYACINTVSQALMGKPLYHDLKIIGNKDAELEPEQFQSGCKTRIAVQIHMFYTDILEETIACINQIPYDFDCFISTDTKQKKERIEKAMKEQCRCKHFFIERYENRGRDVAPFLLQMKDRLCGYDYICHIHSKKTKTEDHGNDWRNYIYDHLFGSQKYLKRLFSYWELNSDIGIVMPQTYPVLELQAVWGGNKEGTAELLQKLNKDIRLPKEPVFPVGNMFWAKTSAISELFFSGISQADFPPEEGQVNLTLAHQIERAWVYLAQASGYRYQKVFNACTLRKNKGESGQENREDKKHRFHQKRRILSYVHYDKDNVISDVDLETLKVFSKICEKVLFVTNSSLSQEELKKVEPYTCHILQRQNTGYDFGAWKDVLYAYGREKISQYDELVLLNNSCFVPVFDIQDMFLKMEGQGLDFWGNTISPFSPDGSYIHETCIQEHLQSYFMVFHKKVLKSEVFWEFWEHLPVCSSLLEVIQKCETKFTKLLADAGFSYAPYIRETYYLSRFLNNYAVPYEKPCTLLLLKSPFVKKKCYQYMSMEEKVKLEYLVGQLKNQR
ncbi:MAG: glycoside hydrolase family 99-like domain-containing protein [Eubacterium sp.]|nr:glycoside hydrolase family 99-like domain-containing protein [Eubacterium sp.]